jgi:DNA-binding MarR family transcriptional regulator
MTRRPLTPAMLRALSALALAENGTLSDASLRAAIGGYATNCILSLQERGLIRPSEGFFDDDGELWTLTPRGSMAWAHVAPADRPKCCSTCGQLLPAAP